MRVMRNMYLNIYNFIDNESNEKYVPEHLNNLAVL